MQQVADWLLRWGLDRHREWQKTYMRARPSGMLQRRSFMAAFSAAGALP
jgi:hypothetical protein